MENRLAAPLQDIQQNDDGLIPLDILLARLGAWNGPDILDNSIAPEKRAKWLAIEDFSAPHLISHALEDPDGELTSVLTSSTKIDLQSGVIEDNLLYWHHNGETSEALNDQHFLSSRFRMAPKELWQNENIPCFYPETLWVKGVTVWQQNDTQVTDHNRADLNRFIEYNKRFKEGIKNKKPVAYFTSLVHGNKAQNSFSKALFSEEPFLKGTNKTGWDPVARNIDRYFASIDRAKANNDEITTLTLPSTPGISSLDRLKHHVGMTHNTLIASHNMIDGKSEFAADIETGISYVTRPHYFYDEKKQTHVFSLQIAPQDIPQDLDAESPFELLRLEYKEKSDGVYALTYANMMEGDASRFTGDQEKTKRLIGVMQRACDYISQGEFPPYRDLLFRHGLFNDIDEMPSPPSVDDGGETLWTCLHGSELEKPVFDNFGLGVGSCQHFSNRFRDKNGKPNEVDFLFDVSLETGDSDTEFEAAQPDFMHRIEQIHRGFIVLSHGHFDHNSIAEFAAMNDEDGKGWLQGVDIILKDYDYALIRNQLKSLKIPENQWPNFIRYDTKEALEMYPDLKQIDEDNFVYRKKDEDGNTRAFLQICRNGSQHSALTDMHLLTSCFIPKDSQTGDPGRKFHDTYLLINDTSGIKEHGQDFLSKGQTVLADIYDDIHLDEIMEATQGPDELYIALMEATSTDKSGYAVTSEEFKEGIRQALRILPEGKVPAFVGFSTNHEEYKDIIQVLNEPEFLRHLTAIGASAENRLTYMNNHFVDPSIKLDQVVIEAHHIPQIAYDISLSTLQDRLSKAEEKAAERAEKPRAKKTKDQFLAQDVTYQVLKHVYTQTQLSITNGTSKPHIIFDAFFNGTPEIAEKIAINLGFPPSANPDKPRKMPNFVRNAIGHWRKEQKQNAQNTMNLSDEFQGEKNFTDSDVEYETLRRLEKDGAIKFNPTRDLINQQNFWAALQRTTQDEASMRRTRGSKAANRLRTTALNKLALFLTGPIGSTQEYFATLSKLFRGGSLLDADSISRSTGFNIPSEKIAPIILQPPSMGIDAQIAQDSLIEHGAKRRGMTVIAAQSSGAKIYNAGKDKNHYLQKLHEHGIHVDPNTINRASGIVLPKIKLHRDGHGKYHDMLGIYEAPYFKPSLVENIHIASKDTHQASKEIATRTNKKTSIKDPQDWVARRPTRDQNGELVMADVVYLSPRMRGMNKIAKFGRQYGWEIDMKLFLGLTKRGHNPANALSARDNFLDPTGFQQSIAQSSEGGLPKPHDGSSSTNIRGARQRRLEPSFSEVQKIGGKPQVPTQLALIAQREQWGNATMDLEGL